MGKLSQAIAEGDGITILVEVGDAQSARAAEREGADGLVAGSGASEVRASSELPLLHRGGLIDASGIAADAVLIPAELAHWDEAHALGLECVVRVTRTEDLARALDLFDPDIFFLVGDGEDADPLEELLALLHDIPAGKLAIAELHHATAEDVAELERAGVDAVLVAPGGLAALVVDETVDV